MGNTYDNDLECKKHKDHRLREAIQYIEDRKERLLLLEKEIKEITQNPEWLKAKNYIRVAVNSGKLDETPSKRNCYRKPEYIDCEFDDIYDDNYYDEYESFL